MSQWGTQRAFVAGAAEVVLIAHVTTRGFDRIALDATIDGVTTLSYRGPIGECATLGTRVRERFTGRPYRDWIAP